MVVYPSAVSVIATQKGGKAHWEGKYIIEEGPTFNGRLTYGQQDGGCSMFADGDGCWAITGSNYRQGMAPGKVHGAFIASKRAAPQAHLAGWGEAAVVRPTAISVAGPSEAVAGIFKLDDTRLHNNSVIYERLDGKAAVFRDSDGRWVAAGAESQEDVRRLRVERLCRHVVSSPAELVELADWEKHRAPGCRCGSGSGGVSGQ